MNDNMWFSIYKIEAGGCAFLNDYRTNFCTPNLYGSISPIWLLDQLAGVQFTPATYPHRFPPPAPPVPINILASQTSFPQSSPSQAPTLIELTSVFDHLPTPTLPDDIDSDIMSLIGTQSLSNPLDKSQKLFLKGLLAASKWGRSIKLVKYLFIGHFLVRTPVNPFFVPAAVSRRLITTSFLRALHFNQKPYDELSSEPLTIVNDDGSKTIVGWSYLCNRFLDFYINVTSELRKITRGSTSPLAGFAVNEDQKMGKIFDLIVAFNSADQQQVQEAICDLIGTQAFKEVLWAALLRPIAELAEGVLITLVFTLQIPSDSANLKAPELYPSIMAALDAMYMDPDRFTAFFQVARELPSLQETNILVMDPKNKVPKYMTDEMGSETDEDLE
ncbi:hypothetical protein DFH29DRAFT_999884 [Suillus ampliporus]|nr:hypothetical protein DFH29DRAFT_999884 [Suillus ampliporus]